MRLFYQVFLFFSPVIFVSCAIKSFSSSMRELRDGGWMMHQLWEEGCCVQNSLWTKLRKSVKKPYRVALLSVRYARYGQSGVLFFPRELEHQIKRQRSAAIERGPLQRWNW